MAIYIEMPKLSDTMTEGTLVKWRKNEGDKVRVGDVLADIETDKATMEMEVFDDGVLHRHLVAEGAKIPIGEKIALLLLKGEAPPADGAQPAAPKVPAPAKPSPAAAPAAESSSAKPAPSSATTTAPASSNAAPAAQ